MFEGRFVIVRTYSAGNHMGTLVSQNGREVLLSNARNLHRWSGANSLNEIALRGVDDKGSTRISEPVAEVLLTEAIQIIPCTPVAEANLSRSRWNG